MYLIKDIRFEFNSISVQLMILSQGVDLIIIFTDSSKVGQLMLSNNQDQFNQKLNTKTLFGKGKNLEENEVLSKKALKTILPFF